MNASPEHPARAALRALVQSPGARHLTVGAMARRVGVDRTTARRWIDRDFPDHARERWPTRAQIEAQIMEQIGAKSRAVQVDLINLLPPSESGGEGPGLLE